MDPVEVGLESIASQIGTAVLDIGDGKIVKVRIFIRNWVFSVFKHALFLSPDNGTPLR